LPPKKYLKSSNPKGLLLRAGGRGHGGFHLPYKSFDLAQVGVEINTINYHLKEIFKSRETVENSAIRISCRFG